MKYLLVINRALEKLFGTVVIPDRPRPYTEPRVHLRVSNENEKGGQGRDTVYGSILRHGRAWLRLHLPWNRGWLSSADAEWCFRERETSGVSFDVGGGDDQDVAVHLSLPFFFLYLGLEGALPRLWKNQKLGYRGRTTGLTLYHADLSLHWVLWGDEMGWNSRTPKWRDGWLHPIDSLFGLRDYQSTPLGPPQEVEIPMPEGNYPASIQLALDTWSRKRWPFPLELRRAKVDIPSGIGHPGKGENSWDCGDDAIYSSTFPAQSVEEAIGHVVALVLENRQRYGGRHRFTPRDPPKGSSEPPIEEKARS